MGCALLLTMACLLFLSALEEAAKRFQELKAQRESKEALEMEEAEMFVEGYKAVLVKDTSFKGLWKVSFTLREF